MTEPLAPEPEPLGHTAVYRLYDAAGILLYVGMTNMLRNRLLGHSKDKEWWPDVTRRSVLWFSDRADAEGEEARAILTENPAHNSKGPNTRVPNRRPSAAYASCSVTQARANLTDVLAAAYFNASPTVIEKQGQPRAALIPYPWLEELYDLREEVVALRAKASQPE